MKPNYIPSDKNQKLMNHDATSQNYSTYAESDQFSIFSNKKPVKIKKICFFDLSQREKM